MRPVKRGCPAIDRVRNYRTGTSDFGGGQTAMNGVGKKVSAKAAALVFLGYSKATDKKKRYSVR